MEWYFIFAIILVILGILLVLGMPISFTMGVIGVVGLFIIGGFPSLTSISAWAYGTLNSFHLVAVPLFLILGVLLGYSGISSDIYGCLDAWLGWVPGIKGIASVLACALFSAASGSGVATAMAVGRVAIPEMQKSGYDIDHATATLACAGTLGILIPPSLIMILYGGITAVSIGGLFMGGIIPGLIVAGMMSGYVMWKNWSSSKAEATLATRKEASSLKVKFVYLLRVLPFLCIVVSIIGSIYAGIATPSESAAVGASAAFLLALAYRRLDVKKIVAAGLAATEITAFVLFLVASCTIFGSLLTRLKIPMGLAAFAATLPLPTWAITVVIGILLIAAGVIMDGGSITILTVPLFLPILEVYGVDPIWFGVYLVIALQIGMITPPVAMNLYAALGIGQKYGATVEKTTKASLPFLFILAIAMAIIMIAPDLVLFIPNTMR